MKTHLIGVAVMLALPTVAAAQDPAGQARDAATATLEEVVVTANRTRQAIVDVPSSLEVVTAEELDDTVALNFTDLLKKTAGVDVIQYPNGLAGVSLRGVRPDFEFTINPRTLILVDGRPSGASSFTTLAPESIARVEVLKGPASSLYGASAIGGVVNIITRRSNGSVTGLAGLGYGSFNTLRAELSAGGSITDRADFDIGLGYVDQFDNLEIGGGVERPNSDYDRLSGRARLGFDVTDRLRLDVSVDGATLSNNASGPFSFNPPTSSGTELARVGGDIQADLDLGSHRVHATAYRSGDVYEFITVPATGPRYRSSRTRSDYRGLLLQDNWTLADPLSITYGFDWQRVEITRFAYNVGEVPRAPFSPNEVRDTKAVFAEAILKAFDDRLIITAGARQDWIRAETLLTPMLTTFRPGATDFEVFSPRGGVVFKLTDDWRLHATAGTGFAPPQGNQIAGVSEEIAGAQRRLTSGNPDLKPEDNITYDFGVGYESGVVSADLTYFDSRTSNRITTIVRTNTATLRETTYVNANEATFRGLEAQARVDAGAAFGAEPERLTVSASLTRLFESEELIAGVVTPIRNVADWKGTLSATASNGDDLSATVTARYNGGRFDADNSQGFVFTGGRGGVFEYPSFTTIDASLRWDVTERDTLRFEASNLFDEAYYEKADYPMPGRAFYVRYQRGF